MIYKHLGYRKKLLTEQDIVDRAAGRKWRNSMWTFAYREHRRHLGIWSAVFLLVAMLLLLIPLGTLLFARYGRP